MPLPQPVPLQSPWPRQTSINTPPLTIAPAPVRIAAVAVQACCLYFSGSNRHSPAPSSPAQSYSPWASTTSQKPHQRSAISSRISAAIFRTLGLAPFFSARAASFQTCSFRRWWCPCRLWGLRLFVVRHARQDSRGSCCSIGGRRSKGGGFGGPGVVGFEDGAVFFLLPSRIVKESVH